MRWALTKWLAWRCRAGSAPEHSVADAKKLAENLGIEFHIVPIKPIHDQFESHPGPRFCRNSADVTEENIQARIRGVLLMAFSNKFNHLLLTTGNKSEVGRRDIARCMATCAAAWR